MAASPIGRFGLCRPSTGRTTCPRPRTGLRPRTPSAPRDGWSDDPRDRRYNRLVPAALPHQPREDVAGRSPLRRGGRHRLELRSDRARARQRDLPAPRAARISRPPKAASPSRQRMIRRLLERIGPQTRIEIVGSSDLSPATDAVEPSGASISRILPPSTRRNRVPMVATKVRSCETTRQVASEQNLRFELFAARNVHVVGGLVHEVEIRLRSRKPAGRGGPSRPARARDRLLLLLDGKPGARQQRAGCAGRRGGRSTG